MPMLGIPDKTINIFSSPQTDIIFKKYELNATYAEMFQNILFQSFNLFSDI